MSYTKKQWTKPQLIVLARGTPEEAVLTHCKTIDQTGTGASGDPYSAAQVACNRQHGGQDNFSNCGACQSRSGS